MAARTTADPPSFSRYIIGPLTTPFTPTSACATGFVPASTSGFVAADEKNANTFAVAYLSDCRSSRQCLPGTSTWAPFGFYSPGWVCLVGWTTATVVSQNMTDSSVPTNVLSRLVYPETAAFCCPEGFTFSFGTVIAYSATLPNMCISTMIGGDFVFKTCNDFGNSEPRLISVGQNMTYTTAWTTRTVTVLVANGGPNTITAIGPKISVSTITTQPIKEAFTAAPAVQIVWRPNDLPQGGGIDSPSSTPNSHLSPGAIAGIAIGTFLFTLLLTMGIFLWFRRRRSQRPRTSDPANSGPTGTTTALSGVTTAPDQSYHPYVPKAAELPALPAGQAHTNAELPGSAPVIQSGPIFELDGTPIPSPTAAEAQEKTMPTSPDTDAAATAVRPSQAHDTVPACLVPGQAPRPVSTSSGAVSPVSDRSSQQTMARGSGGGGGGVGGGYVLRTSLLGSAVGGEWRGFG